MTPTRRISPRHQATDRLFGQHPQLQDLLCEDTTDDGAQRLAGLVAAYRAHHGHRLTWAEFGATQTRPELAGFSQAVRRAYADRLVRVLARRGWLTFDAEPGSLAPGPALGGS